MRIDIDQRSRGHKNVSAQWRIAVSFDDAIDPRIDGNTWQARAAIKVGDLYIAWVQESHAGLGGRVAEAVATATEERQRKSGIRAQYYRVENDLRVTHA